MNWHAIDIDYWAIANFFEKEKCAGFFSENDFIIILKRSNVIVMQWFMNGTSDIIDYETVPSRVSVQGVESLWGDCRFIQADWGL